MKIKEIREKILEFLLDINDCEDDEVEHVKFKLWDTVYEIDNSN